jgi:hypothetical protein
MLGLISQEILRYQYLLVRSEEIWVSLHRYFSCLFFCETYVIFMLFLFLYIIFFIPKYLMDMCLLCVDMGPVRPVDYVRNKCHPRPGATPAAVGGPTAAGELLVKEVERVLR